MAEFSTVFPTKGKLAVDGASVGRRFTWPDGVVPMLGGDVRNRVIGVETWVESGIVWVQGAEVGDFFRRATSRRHPAREVSERGRNRGWGG
jgi:hypothetical protein